MEAEKLEAEQAIKTILEDKKEELTKAWMRLERFGINFDVRKLAACTMHNSNNFYILCGWMSESDARASERKLRGMRIPSVL